MTVSGFLCYSSLASTQIPLEVSVSTYDLTFPEPRVWESPASSQNGTIKTQAGKTQPIIRKLSCYLEQDTQNRCWQRGPWEAGRGRACLRMELSGDSCGDKTLIKGGIWTLGKGAHAVQIKEREPKGRSGRRPDPLWRRGKNGTQFKERTTQKSILRGLNSTRQILKDSFLFLLDNCLQTNLYLMRSLNIITLSLLHAYFIALLNPSNNIALGGIINLFRTLTSQQKE